jgi:AraC family transcriptional regulator
MLTNTPSTPAISRRLFDRYPPDALQARVFDRHGREEATERGPWTLPVRPGGAIDSAVQIYPADGVRRRAMTWDGMAAEIVQVTRRERTEFRFQAPRHLLIVHEQGARHDGETMVEGLPRSSLRDVKHKLTFVPAGHEYRDWQEPRTLARVVYFYFDPAKMPIHPGSSVLSLAPRMFFEDPTLWDTALKLKTLMESAGADNRLYLEALGTVLAHELVRLNAGTPRIEAQARGGEEHVAEHIPLATLAQLARLSPYYFCRAFKQSFGLPPHRYHNDRRIELAKTLLAKPMSSVTDVGLAIGFSETSSFTAAFRKTTGLTPTAFRRSLA